MCIISTACMRTHYTHAQSQTHAHATLYNHTYINTERRARERSVTYRLHT